VAAKKPAPSVRAAASKPAVSAAGLAKAAKAARAAQKPADKPAAARAPGQGTAVETIARTYFEALTARDAAAAARLWDKGGVQDLVPIGIFRGPGAIEQFFQEMFTAMPDLRFEVERITADAGVAAVQWRLAGTFSAGSFQGLEPNGRRVELRGTDCLEIDDGRIMRNTAVFDGAAFARQIGLLPAEDSGADRAIRAGFNTVTKLRRSVARRTTG